MTYRTDSKAPVHSKDFADMISEYFEELLRGVGRRDDEKIEEAKQFCLSLTRSLAAKQFADLHRKREASNNRYLKDVNF